MITYFWDESWNNEIKKIIMTSQNDEIGTHNYEIKHLNYNCEIQWCKIQLWDTKS